MLKKVKSQLHIKCKWTTVKTKRKNKNLYIFFIATKNKVSFDLTANAESISIKSCCEMATQFMIS